MKFKLEIKGETIGEGPLPQGVYRIGRSANKDMPAIWGPCFSENGIVIAEPNTTVSRDHLAINVSADRMTLVDQGSRNGSYLERQRFTTKHVEGLGMYQLTLGDLEAGLKLEILATE
jgi:pSer/pThr/pTyr-binding forkhead associated (FHA) protein